ncbi:MAG: M10 family metallopeptidase C-terminal domain-containing protein [Rhizobium sp.]|nr:M10 family metallopeptidase C-terminal domain-containing protein [Rhizobium sp.]
MCGYCNQVQNITSSGDNLADGVTYGVKWDGPISYAFPALASDYNYTHETAKNFSAATTEQQTAALFALEQTDGNAANDGFSVEGFTAIDIFAGDAKTAHIRFGQSDAPATAYAYMPGTYNQAGDLWFGRNYDYTNAQAGNYAWHTILHEIGHALGLKHGHETQTGFAALPTEYDSLEYSIMTYRSYVGDNVGPYSYSTWSAPQTYMMADIAALQSLYGADFTTNSGDTVYKWTPGSGDTLVNGEIAIDAGGTAIFATIWDGGGKDVYDLSAYTTDLVIDLGAGGASRFGEDQPAYLGSGHDASGNIYNAMLYQGDERSLIEAAIGGSGNDTIEGNQARNLLSGGEGDDMLRGRSGQDRLVGGEGADRLFGGRGSDKLSGGSGNDILTGGAGKDVFRFSFGDGRDVVTDFTQGDDRIALRDFGLYGLEDVLSLSKQSGDDVIINLIGSTSIVVEDMLLSLFTAEDFKFAL